MTDYRPRLFASDAAVERVGEGLLARSLPRDEWTHEAHLAATTYLLLRHPEIDLDEELPGIIRRYNESVGGVNSDTEGYHDTITRVYLHGIRLFLSEASAGEPQANWSTTSCFPRWAAAIGRFAFIRATGCSPWLPGEDS